MAVDRRGLRDFALRDFGALAELEARERAEEYRKGGPAWSWRRALELREHLRRVRPEWPTQTELEEDLAAAVSLAALLRRAGGGFTAR